MRTRILKRKLAIALRGGKPLWTDFPETIMFDTTNFCNLDCEYCNVQHSFGLPHGFMDFEVAKTVLKHYGRKPFLYISPFGNGEPLLDKRLPQFFDLAHELCNTPCVIDTNGTNFALRKMLVHPNLEKVRFTISAVTPQTYEKVHGKPYFYRAMSTFYWFLHNRLPHQQVWLHFIVSKNNEHEITRWIRHFQGFGRTVYPVHEGEGIQLNSTATKSGKVPIRYMLDTRGNRVDMSHSNYKPCPCWDIMAVAWSGEIMQCIDFPYKYNWGKVGEVDLDKAWRERVENKLDNPCCRACSLKFSNWKETMDRWV